MNDLTEEAKELFSASIKELEATVVEDPIALPVIVIEAMLVDVTRRVFIATVGRWELLKIVQAA
ncbi:hypothetical protein D9M70_503050 [compost metagenome]